MSLNFGGFPPLISELAALERLKNPTISVVTLAPSFLIGSASFMQVRMTTIISRTSSIRPHSAELATVERLKKFP